MLLFLLTPGGRWKLGQKIIQEEKENDIVTPNGLKIGVGANLDQVLVFSVGFNNWKNKSKTFIE